MLPETTKGRPPGSPSHNLTPNRSQRSDSPLCHVSRKISSPPGRRPRVDPMNSQPESALLPALYEHLNRVSRPLPSSPAKGCGDGS